MPLPEHAFLDRLAHEPAVLVSVAASRGSVPREVGAWMGVFASGLVGTIGGGHLEWDAERRAREALARPPAGAWEEAVALGPSLGQCCGGTVRLRFECVSAADAPALTERLRQPLQPLALFGGGHVGRALVQALSPLPYAVRWVDSRDEVFPDALAPTVHTEHSDPVQAAVRELAAGSHVLIMSFSHAEDLDIVAACLARVRQQDDLGFIGLIGSRTKWATFGRRLRERGFSEAECQRVTCPIGLPGITGKAPAVIAASVVAQLLLRDSATSSP
jgi:xanthine dehydrogenase accessory factor